MLINSELTSTKLGLSYARMHSSTPLFWAGGGVGGGGGGGGGRILSYDDDMVA